MHDLAHDFALSISKSETLIWEGESLDNFSNVLHLFVQFDGHTTPGISGGICRVTVNRDLL